MRRALLVSAVWAGLSLVALASSSSADDLTEIESPCDTEETIDRWGDESWELGKRIPESWRRMIDDAWSDDKPAVTFLWIGAMLKGAQVSAEAKAFGSYLLARNYDRLKLPHAAWEGYQATLLQDTKPETLPIRAAAAQCLARLQSSYPSLELPPETLAALQRLPADATRRDLAFRAFAQSGQLAAVRGLGPTETLARGFDFAAGGADSKAVVQFRDFLDKTDADWEELGLQSRRDSFQLLYGYALHGKQDYAEAILQFQKIPNASNLFPDALRAKAWSELLSGQFEPALGTAENFIVGAFRNQFSPSSYLVAAVTLNETCNFSEANELIAKFKKRYQLVFSWLKYWDQRFNTRASNPYQVLVQYLGKKQKLLEPIAQEWIKTPTFLANQSELNAMIDSRKTLRWLADAVQKESVKQNNPKTKAAGAVILAATSAASQLIARREPRLVQEISQSLQERTRAMMADTRDVYDNMQLVEVEVHNSFAERVLAERTHQTPSADDGARDRTPAGAAAEAKREATARKINTVAKWDWGALPEDAEKLEGEVWDDEVGYLSSAIENRCAEKGRR